MVWAVTQIGMQLHQPLYVYNDPGIIVGTRLLQSQFGTEPSAPTPAPPMTGQQGHIPQGTAEEVNPWNLPPKQAYPAWSLKQPLSMHVHLSTSPIGDVFSPQWTSGWRKDQDEELPSFVWENITFGDWNDARVVSLDVKLPDVS
jgi:hypothetical protein